MERSYERQLAQVVGRLPEEPAVVALIPTIPLDQAAALASDVAQIVGSTRSGHTILTSLEPAQARLDHEIGVEEGDGLTDVLAGKVTVAQAAAHGRARRFIYLPAGARPGPGERLLRSDAWRALVAGILARRGTVLAFIPPEAFEAVNALPSEGAGRRFDALVWLGSAPEPHDGVHAAAIASGALDAGAVDLPGPSSSPRPAGDAGAAATPASTPASARSTDGRPRSAQRPGLVGLRRRSSRRRKKQSGSKARLATLLVVAGALSLWAGYEIRSRLLSDREPGAPDFARPDSLATDTLAADSVPPDSLAPDTAGTGGAERGR